MNITHLRERMLIQSRAMLPDNLGGYKNTWANRGEIWASVTPLESDKEQLDETKELVSPRYRLRWRVGSKIPVTARLLWRDQILRLLTVPREDVYRRFVSVIAQGEVKHE